jgi:hypothetical protein
MHADELSPDTRKTSPWTPFQPPPFCWVGVLEMLAECRVEGLCDRVAPTCEGYSSRSQYWGSKINPQQVGALQQQGTLAVALN